MKKSKFTEEQIAFALRQAESGTRVVEVCRKMGIAEQTYFRWKKKYGGLGVSELRRLRQLEEENRQLKRLVADLTLDKQMLQDVLSNPRLPGLKAGAWSGLTLSRASCPRLERQGLALANGSTWRRAGRL